jgi:hypothetical protein
VTGVVEVVVVVEDVEVVLVCARSGRAASANATARRGFI